MRALSSSLLLCLVILNGCTPTGFVNAFISPDLEVIKDIAYGDLERQTLDLYRQLGAEPKGVVMFVHGGYWDSGDKAQYAFVADALVRLGYVAALPNYRLVPEITFPTYAEDIARATVWVLDAFDDELAGVPDNVFLMGHSAGGHIAALVAFDEQYLDERGYSNSDLSGFVGLAGAYDFLPLAPDDERSRAALGPTENHSQTQPVNFASANDPPALLATGLADTTVNPRNSFSFAEALRTAGAEVTLTTYEGVDHSEILGGLSEVARFLAPQVFADVKTFLDAHAP